VKSKIYRIFSTNFLSLSVNKVTH